METCVFCKIIEGQLPSQMVYQNETIVAFHDLNPVAPVHVLIVPRQHTADLLELADSDHGSAIMAALPEAVQQVARLTNVDQSGFRLINNCGRDGGQTVRHIHFHLIGGRPLGEKLL
ncbi:MAG: histidine triad nucleotide-binding protein [Clostridiaceae bacterium]|jgi:histidine triad (HIT) family protein|nr:histidine triad nucleotide-binding protein [Clostridiaceae bacterium]